MKYKYKSVAKNIMMTAFNLDEAQILDGYFYLYVWLDKNDRKAQKIIKLLKVRHGNINSGLLEIEIPYSKVFEGFRG